MTAADVSSPTGLGAALARVEAFAAGVTRRTRFWGVVALLAGPALWALVLYRWVFDSWRAALAWSPVLLALLVPGLVLLGFAGRVRRVADLPDRVSGEVAAMVSEARDGVAEDLQGVKTSGMAGLRSLVGSLKGLRAYGDEAREIVSAAAGTVRLLNPVYLLVVVGAAVAAGFLAAFLLAALLLVLVL